MKKVIVLVALMTGFASMAQKGEKRHRDNFKDMSVEQMATLKTKKMALELDLSDAQQSEIQALNLEMAKTRKAKMEERKAAKTSGERKEPTSDERYAMKVARLDNAIAHKAELQKVLSKEQFEKWERLHQRSKKRRKGKPTEGRKGRKGNK